MLNRGLNVSTGLVGIVYVLSDILYQIVVWCLMSFNKMSYLNAFKLADHRGFFFTFILGLTCVLSLISLIALVSNLILFMRADFFLRILLTLSAFFLPYLHGQITSSILSEILFVGLFLLYCNKIKGRKQDFEQAEFKNYKQL